jgi:hypothetical protein
MGRGGHLAALLFALLCAGCMGSDGESEGGPAITRSPQPPTQPATTTVEETLPSPQRWATPAERVWLERYGQWSLGLTSTSDQILERSDELTELAATSDEAALRELERLVAPLRSCADDFRRLVPDAPTTRLREVGDLVEAACERHERGVAQLLEGLAAGELGRTAREQAIVELARAATSFSLVNARLPPGAVQRLPIIEAPTRASHRNPRYGQAAGSLVEQRTEVRCWSQRDWRRLLREATLVSGTPFRVADTGGFTMIGGGTVNLAPFVCGLLDALVYGRVRPRDRDRLIAMSFGVSALAHEAFHRAGTIDEATTECYGMQRIFFLARELDVPGGYARELARAAWQTYETLPPEYRSPECRSGGELDIDPVIDGPWDY